MNDCEGSHMPRQADRASAGGSHTLGVWGTGERWYIAGPMRGYPCFNFPAFDFAAGELARRGHEWISPAEHDRDVYPDIEQWPGFAAGDVDSCPAFDYHATIRWDLAQIIDPATTGVALLPGWERSTGARLERDTCIAVGKPIVYIDPDDGYFGFAPHRPIVGLLGYAGAGKDTAALGLIDKGWRRHGFADALKNVAAEIGWNGEKDDAGRVLLQNLGVAVRELVDPDAWVSALERDIDEHTEPVVLPDVRFPNEIAWLRERHGLLVRIDRPGTGPANAHISEHAWCATPPDFVLVNDGTPEDLARDLAALVA